MDLPVNFLWVCSCYLNRSSSIDHPSVLRVLFLSVYIQASFEAIMYQPIILYSHATGPNPWKVAIILEELGLKYESKYVEMADMKKRPFEGINPNGRSVHAVRCTLSV